MTPARTEHLIALQGKALSAAKELRTDRKRLDEGVWKRLTDALLDARSAMMKERKERARMTSDAPYFYLATVYTKHPDGREAAFREAAEIAGRFLRAGVNVHSPIAHSHPIAVHGGVDAVDHDFWMWADRPAMDSACGLVVCRMPNWQKSRGIAEEIKVFTEAGKPVLYYDP